MSVPAAASRHFRLVAAALVLLGPVRFAAAQKPSPSRPETWGTTQISYVQVPAAAFRPRSSDVPYDGGAFGESIFTTGTGGFPDFVAGLSLPSGAQVVYVELDFHDASAEGEVLAKLSKCDWSGDQCLDYPFDLLHSGIPFHSGSGLVSADLTGAEVYVDNFFSHYQLLAELTVPLDAELRGMIVGYRLRVSDPPGQAHFNDVPVSHPFFQYVEALYASGTTGGCSVAPPLYCPDAALTRGQMAVFLAKALGLHFQ